MTEEIRQRIEQSRTRVVDDEADLVRRAMILRKAKRIGILWAEQGKYFVSESEFDPWGTRIPLSLDRLRAMVGAAEIDKKGIIYMTPFALSTGIFHAALIW